MDGLLCTTRPDLGSTRWWSISSLDVSSDKQVVYIVTFEILTFTFDLSLFAVPKAALDLVEEEK